MDPAPQGRSLLTAVGTLSRALPGLAPTFLVVALLACVLVPLPTALVDLLLSISLAGAVLLLVASLGIRRTTDFLNFPSLLLLATLFRLALNVSTTRLILSEAYAGKVIDAFAGFVVRSDLIVGGVMFVIITIVQYVVIARGAERVAEVAARFALDGLPGHQAAIDADLRAGVISAGEAAKRRAKLAERSNFYGAMDGAVRFVKGDAVAGLAITTVNLLGGLAIGIGRLGYTWQESLEVYGRLTVGDGLLAQIPALLVSLAAGVLVSRVDRQDERDFSAIGWLEPAMLVVPATMLIVLAAVPAMPSLAFITTAVALLTVAVVLAARRSTGRLVRPHTAERQIEVVMAEADVEDKSAMERALGEVQLQASAALGIEVPEVELNLRSDHPRGEVEVLLDERRCGRGEVTRGREGEDAVVIATYRAIMDSAESLIDLQDLDRSLEQVRASHPVVVERALQQVDLADLLAVSRGFLRERIPLPPLRHILATMAEGRRFGDPAERPHFAEIVRRRLALHWVHPVLDSVRRLGRVRWLRLTPDAEEELLDRSTASADGTALSLSTVDRKRWLQVLQPAPEPEEDEEAERGPIVVITTPRARPAAAALVAGTTPLIRVLSTAELNAAEESVEPTWVDVP